MSRNVDSEHSGEIQYQIHRKGIQVTVDIPRVVCFFASAVAFSSTAIGEEPQRANPTAPVLERFQIEKGGDLLRIPVRIDGTDYWFMIDTGSGTTVCDCKLPIKKTNEQRRVSTPSGPTSVPMAKLIGATVGGCHSLPVPENVIAQDLTLDREFYGVPIDGVLGMDFLAQHIVRIDFDAGNLSFLVSLPPKQYKEIPLSSVNGCPCVEAELPHVGKHLFVADTGHCALCCGMMESDLLRRLALKGEIQLFGAGEGIDAKGENYGRAYRGTRLTVQGFSVERPVFCETSRSTVLGLGFWSRFVVTFDFPRNRLFLREGKSYGRRDDRINLSGLDYRRRHGDMTIVAVDESSPGAKAGILIGDVLLRVGDINARESSTFALEVAFSQAGKAKCLIRRGETKQEVSLDLVAPEQRR
jgi:hypothetical protein